MKKFGLVFYILFTIVSNLLIILFLGWYSILFLVGLVLAFRFLFSSMYHSFHNDLKQKIMSENSSLSKDQIEQSASMAAYFMLIFSPITSLISISIILSLK